MRMLHGELDSYTQLQSADAILEAARNPGGGAAAGVGIGMGAALGQRAMTAAPLAPPAPAAPAAAAIGTFEPPPLPSAAWYFAEGNERKGPVDEATLRSVGSLTPETLVWKHGMAEWTPAGRVPDLATMLAQRKP